MGFTVFGEAAALSVQGNRDFLSEVARHQMSRVAHEAATLRLAAIVNRM